MSEWDWLQNKHECDSLILPRGTENNKDLENKLWHLTALGRWVFCTCPWCFIRTFVLIWTFIHQLSCICIHCFIPRGCTMKQSEQCQASIIKTGSTKPESKIWAQVMGHHLTLSTQCSLLNSVCLQVFLIVLISSIINMNHFVLTATDTATNWRWTWKSCRWLGVTFRLVYIINWTLWYFCAWLL